ncbi:hypothetical protein P4O66_016937 [Electrophorus voltai]|uniref:non-specific serine/threonine protein kinase n=1 Tax=Electrophorus voltai TaxID=2609070 RepID=A0AAD8YZ63_9TELE|nr:hypothetical protein P4O66_016937 [Electrophorus voltai]
MPLVPVSIGATFLSPPLKETHASLQTLLAPTLSGAPEENTAHQSQPARRGEPSGTCREHRCSSSSEESSSQDKEIGKEADDISAELSRLILLTGKRFLVSEEKRIAYVTLDLDSTVNFTKGPDNRGAERSGNRAPCEVKPCSEKAHKAKMPHKTSKMSSEGKTRSKHRQRKANQQLQPQAATQKSTRAEPLAARGSAITVIETIAIKEEKMTPECQGKKKKKKHDKAESAAPVAVESTVRPEAGKPQGGEATPLPPKAGRAREKTTPPLPPTPTVSAAVETPAIGPDVAVAGRSAAGPEPLSTRTPQAQDDDIIKRRRISVRTRPQLPTIFRQRKENEEGSGRAHGDVVRQKIQTPKEEPRVLAEIQVAPVLGDAQSISLWCQFSPVSSDASITWTKEGVMLSEEKRREGDDSRVTLSIERACSKDLGRYRCALSSLLGSVCTCEYHLTSEVLMEFVIPSHDTVAECREVDGEEEAVHCSPLLFKDSILTDQYFGEDQPASIVTEKTHFGEGMHRRAFRATLRAGVVSGFSPGHPCVLKVHNSISYGTKNNEELTQRNYDLAVEECFVQNTAREYIKAYTDIAKSAEAFGEVPEIIPIFLVHRPSSMVPYATLEEELIGDFVKYSVKDGKEINLTRRDSESGQKCCTFQHWVYEQTEGNLLVTDMQGVGMKLTDVGIATCKKGYKGFKGNCSTSFIDQFQALHQCNRFCELLGLSSLQPKPKRTVAPPSKVKPQPGPKKQPFGSILKGKS